MLRRSGALICGAWVIGLILMASLEGKSLILKVTFVLGFVLLFLALYWVKGKEEFKIYQLKGQIIVLSLIMFVSACVNFEVRNNYEGSLIENEGENIQVRGLVTGLQKDEDKNHQFIIKTENEKALVRAFDNEISYSSIVGRYVYFNAEISRPEPARNPRCFDYAKYLKTKGIYTLLTKKSNISIYEKKENKFFIFCENVRNNFANNVYGYFDKDIASILIGMSFGDKSGIDSEDYIKFQRNGICHILAVSGLHIGALYAFLNIVTGNRKKKIIYIIEIIVLFMYVGLANFAPSVIRAFLMIVMHIAASLLKKRYDMMTASFFTMLVMTIFNPLLVLNVGFQLSFCAILTLASLMPAVLRISKNIFVSSAVMQIGMAPLSAYIFNYFSFSAFLLNIPVIFLSGFLIPLVLLMMLISNLANNIALFPAEIFDTGFQIIGIIAEFLTKLIIFLNDITLGDIKPYILVKSPDISIIFVYYSLMFFVSSEFLRIFWQRKFYKKIAAFLATITLLAFICGQPLRNEFDKCELIFCDVGQGDCLLVRSKDGKNILLDTGGSIRIDVGEKIVLPFLLKNGVNHLDMVLISHFDKDHVGGLASLEKNIKIDRVAIYEANAVIPEIVEEKTGVKRDKYLCLAKGDVVKLSKNLNIEILFPKHEQLSYYKATRPNIKDENLISLVAKVNLKNISVLMTGDLDFNTEKAMVDLNSKSRLKCDILKVSHHGSRYGSSEELLSCVMPKLAVVQVGKNNYGHPNEDTLNRIEKTGAKIYRNDKNGAVGVQILNNSKLSVKTMF